MRADTGDDYARLGLQRGATLAQVKSAYRRLAFKLHPDRAGGDPAKAARFTEVADAYRRILAELEKDAPKAGTRRTAPPHAHTTEAPRPASAPPIDEAVRLSDRVIEFSFAKVGEKLGAKADRLGSWSTHAKSALKSVLDIGAQAAKERAEAAIRRGGS